jgi:hypothetical protein
MQPQNWTLHIRSAYVQSIAIPQVNRRHTNHFPTLFTLIVRFDLIDPVVSYILGAVLAEPDVDEEVGVGFARSEVWTGICGAELFVNSVAKK